MAKSNLYTGGGDKGLTSLCTGQRVPKDSLRLETYGTIDEFSSFLGCVAANPDCPQREVERLLSVQNMLFNIGATLAMLPDGEEPVATMGLTEASIDEMEKWIDETDEATPRIKAFVLPGGSQISAQAHVARTVCRRAERRIVTLAGESPVDPLIARYINRLSDYLFILARYFNHITGSEEIIWHKA